MTGTLFIVGTPIGNFEDITKRALRILGEADLIVAEDTRHTKKLLAHFSLRKPLVSFHKFSSGQPIERILDELKSGKNVAYVVDAGTPGISDPGSYLVEQILKEQIPVVPIPGVSAPTALLSVAGIPTDRFRFVGFFPKKKGRQTLLKEIQESDEPVVFFESPHRIIKTLEELQKAGDFYVIVGRELTKTFETIYRGTIKNVLPQISKQVKGEFTVVIQTHHAN